MGKFSVEYDWLFQFSAFIVNLTKPETGHLLICETRKRKKETSIEQSFKKILKNDNLVIKSLVKQRKEKRSNFKLFLGCLELIIIFALAIEKRV
ncbi:hypothetical protein BC643_1349 [Mangrovibacterium diazotrophicum]|uniref:Uncharacterized protein n=1 Tax=Mangrovibacterium diazotrophicum TaxID=1261403 RepID=A0A419W6A3_9BACT|nr:hypothetical protein BC643_1349 [Mangrovibacterium diazotrophicum]